MKETTATYDFLPFVTNFAKIYDELPCRMYKSDDGKYFIEKVAVFDNSPDFTTRVNHRTGLVQVNDSALKKRECTYSSLLFLLVWGFVRNTVVTDTEADSMVLDVLREQPDFDKKQALRKVGEMIAAAAARQKERLDNIEKLLKDE